MTDKFDPVHTCVCCGISLPGTRQELIARGAATIQGNGQVIFHCPTHSAEGVAKMITATPVFSTGSNYRKNPI